MNVPECMKLDLNLALGWLSQARGVNVQDVVADRVHTDSRSLQTGDLFVALRGERFDGNDFIAQAKAQGAVAVVCEASGEELALTQGLPALVVPDARIALGELAAGWRAQFSLPLIAVTGSNGKTTVTQMIASILRAHAGDDALSTQGNLNNDIGVPLTLFNLRAHHRIAVVELGMNHSGEIAYLSQLARPTVALVNNAQREHQEFIYARVARTVRPACAAVLCHDLGPRCPCPGRGVCGGRGLAVWRLAVHPQNARGHCTHSPAHCRAAQR